MCVNTGYGNCVDNCGCQCSSCCNNDCGNCQDPCAVDPCGCPFEVSAACVRIDGNPLDCLEIQPGNTLEDTLNSINQILCELSSSEDGENGDSAYQIWLNLGNAGTEQDFIDSLMGLPGQGTDHISFTSSSLGGAAGQPGATDTYTVWADAGETTPLGTLIVYNGIDGEGSESLGLASIISTSTAIVNTTVENTLQGTISGSLDISAGELQVGNTYQLQASGNIFVGAPTDLNIRLTSNGSEIAGSGNITMPNLDDPGEAPYTWHLSLIFTVRSVGVNGVIATSGTFMFHEITAGNSSSYSLNNIQTSFNTTVNNSFDLTAQWSFADLSNSIECETLIFNRLK